MKPLQIILMLYACSTACEHYDTVLDNTKWFIIMGVALEVSLKTI